MRVDNDTLGDGRRTRTQKEPKRQSNKCSQKSKEKEKGKTWKKINFSQETLSSNRISKELISKQQIPNYETPPLKRPRVIFWGPRPMLASATRLLWVGGSRAVAPTNTTRTVLSSWTLPQWKNDAIVVEGIIESPPPSKLKCHLQWWRVGGREKVMSSEEEKSMTWVNEDPDCSYMPT
jgi:hypothetical protein